MAALHAEALPPGWSDHAISQLLSAPGALGFLFLDAGLAGFVLARAVLDEAEILTIAVGAGHRRRGVGGSLLEAATQAVRSAGALQLHLEVASDNAGACALYIGAGFTCTGRRTRYYSDGADALLMTRTLAPAIV